MVLPPKLADGRAGLGGQEFRTPPRRPAPPLVAAQTSRAVLVGPRRHPLPGLGTPSHGVSVATIQEQTLPIEPTQIAVATTKQDIQRPKVLGDTIAKPHAVIVTTTRANAVAPSTPVISVRMLPDATQSPVVPIVAPASTRYASVWNFFLMSPETTLRYAYYLIAFLVICALFLTTGFEFQRHHMRHVAVAGCLLVAMCGLFFVADRAVFGTTMIAQNTKSSLNS